MNVPEPYIDPISHGNCEVKDCASPAKRRVSWAQGTIVKLVCAAHGVGLEGKRYVEVDPSTFTRKRRTS